MTLFAMDGRLHLEKRLFCFRQLTVYLVSSKENDSGGNSAFKNYTYNLAAKTSCTLVLKFLFTIWTQQQRTAPCRVNLGRFAPRVVPGYQ